MTFEDKYFRIVQGQKGKLKGAKNEYERKKINERYGVVEEVAV